MTLIINKENLSVASYYEGEPNQARYGGPWGNSSLFAHMVLPEGLEIDAIIVQRNQESNEIEIVEDEDKAAEKVQAARNKKLARLRELRDEKLKECDVMVNDIVLGARSDNADVLAYRDALKDVTTPYKYVSDANKAKAAIDAIDPEDFDWPSTPESSVN